jgi:hypothetical protein
MMEYVVERWRMRAKRMGESTSESKSMRLIRELRLVNAAVEEEIREIAKRERD